MRRATIYEALEAKLGRAPTHREQVDEVTRILREANETRLIDHAEKGKLPHQRRRK